MPNPGTVQMSQECKDECIRLYVEENMALRAIAAKVGWSYSAVHRVLERSSVPLRGPGRRRTPGSTRVYEQRVEFTEAQLQVAWAALLHYHDMLTAQYTVEAANDLAVLRRLMKKFSVPSAAKGL